MLGIICNKKLTMVNISTIWAFMMLAVIKIRMYAISKLSQTKKGQKPSVSQPPTFNLFSFSYNLLKLYSSNRTLS